MRCDGKSPFSLCGGKAFIPDEALEHKQLYAQLKQEVLNGERDYLNKEEERELQRKNKKYYRQSLLEDVFFSCFRAPEDEEEGRWLTAAQMFQVMARRNPSALRGVSAKMLSYRLSGMGLKYKHTNHGNYYFVSIQGTALQPIDNQVA